MRANLSSAVIVLVLATGLTGAQDHERTAKENYVIRTTGAAIDIDIDIDVAEKGYLGVEILSQTGDAGATVSVRAVNEGSGAFLAGIEANDQLLVVNGRRIETYSDLTAALDGTEPGQTVAVRVLRDDLERSFDVLLGHRTPQNTVLTELLSPVSEGKWVVVSGHGVDLGAETQGLGDQLAGYFGVDGGVLVVQVEPEGAADRAGVLAGDIIVGWEAESIANADDLAQHTRSAEPGAEVSLTVQRRGGVSRLFITPERHANVNIDLKLKRLAYLGQLNEISVSSNVEVDDHRGHLELVEQIDPEGLRNEIAELESRMQLLRERLAQVDE